MSQTSYDSWVHSQLEPDQMLRGNGKRYPPIRNIVGTWQQQDEFDRDYVEKFGEAAFDKANTIETAAESERKQMEYLKQFGI